MFLFRKNYWVPGNPHMAFKSIRSILTLTLIVILCSILFPTNFVHALTEGSNSIGLPDLDAFIHQVKNGHADELGGIYVPGILAARIVQQPVGMDDFVSSWQGVLTQFSLASRLGSIGLLAHNDLAGKGFASLQRGQEFYLVYGDGSVSTFIVSEIFEYKAIDPSSASSSFIDMKNGDVLTSSELFSKVYNRPGRVIFQTCLEAADSLTWGRLFVIAEPSMN